MNALKKTLPVILAILAVLLPFIILFSAALLTPKVYENTFSAGLDEKFERLNSIDEEKVIIVGGGDTGKE